MTNTQLLIARAFVLAASLLLVGSESTALAGGDCQSSDAADIWVDAPLPDIREVGVDGDGATMSEGPSGDRALRHVVLVDNSLSMYAGYPSKKEPEQSMYVESEEYRDFIANDVMASFRDGTDSAVVMTFEEAAHVWSDSGPQRASAVSEEKIQSLSVDSQEALRTRLGRLTKPASGPGQWSKMLDGLDAAKAVLAAGSGEGVIWLVTDNIYDGIGKGSDSVETSETDENRKFYEAIRDDASYRVVVAYPVVQHQGGTWLRDTSLFVYGIYFDSDTDRSTPVKEVRRLLGDGASGVLASSAHATAMKEYSAPSNPSPGAPFRLKPLNQDVVRISLVSEVEQVQKHQQMGFPVKLKAVLEIENLLKHRVIDTVRFTVQNGVWAGWEPSQGETSGEAMSAILPACGGSFATEEVVLSEPIPPGSTATIEVPLTMPPVDYKLSSAGDVLQIGLNEYVVMGGLLKAELVGLESHMAIPADAFKGTYGAESLPDVFRNPDVRSYTSQFVGRTRKIENPGTVMALGVLVGTALLGGLFGFCAFMLRSVGRRLRVDGVDNGAISFSRLRSAPISAGGRKIAQVKLTMGGAIKVSGSAGFVAKRSSTAWTVSKPGDTTVSVELRTRK